MFEITLTRGYDENNFREDLKVLYQKLGLENKKMVFLFTDAHVAQEGWWSVCIDLLAFTYFLHKPGLSTASAPHPVFILPHPPLFFSSLLPWCAVAVLL